MGINLIAVRIDDRLIHGQGSVWLKSLPINLVLIANDNVSKNEFQQNLMGTLIPPSIESRFFSIDKVIKDISKASDSQKIFLLIESLEDAKKLIDGGVQIKELNIGNIRNNKERMKISPYIYLTAEEKKIIKYFINKKIKLSTKQTPTSEAPGENVDWKKVLDKE